MGRTHTISIALLAALAIPAFADAQFYRVDPTSHLYRRDTPRPGVAVDPAAWGQGSPIQYAGDLYYPTGPTVFFNGRVMTVVGTYDGVPLYADVTLEPYSIVYVPVRGGYMRPYERKRSGEMAGTVGSRMPSFPIERDVELSARSGTLGILSPPVSGIDLWYLADCRRGIFFPTPIPQRCLPPEDGYLEAMPGGAAPQARPRRRREEAAPAAPAPTTPTPAPAPAPAPGAAAAAPARTPRLDVWVDFAGQRWYSAGHALRYDANRFTRIGDLRGHPVYRDTAVDTGRIYVTAKPDGPLAPFERR